MQYVGLNWIGLDLVFEVIPTRNSAHVLRHVLPRPTFWNFFCADRRATFEEARVSTQVRKYPAVGITPNNVASPACTVCEGATTSSSTAEKRALVSMTEGSKCNSCHCKSMHECILAADVGIPKMLSGNRGWSQPSHRHEEAACLCRRANLRLCSFIYILLPAPIHADSLRRFTCRLGRP